MWTRLERQSYPLLRDLFRHQPYPLSIYSLPSLIAWGEGSYGAYYACEGDSVLLAMEEECQANDKYLLMPVSPEIWPPTALYELTQRVEQEKICFVPGDYMRVVGENSVWPWFEIREQPGYADYVYLTSDLAELKGNKYAGKRNLIHQFERQFVERGRVAVDAITRGVRDECLVFLDAWCEERQCRGETVEQQMICERKAIACALDTIEDMSWRGIYIRVDGQISAFAIISELTMDMGVLNFEKAFAHIKGLYQYLDRECARRLFYDRTYINKESDMGIEALAVSKRSYEPIATIKSFCLTAT